MDAPARQLVRTSWVVQRTGLDRTTVKRWAARGLIPGATKLVDEWRFDPELIEGWIEAGRPKPQQTSEPVDSACPSGPAPKADRQGRGATHPGAPSTPPLAVLFPTAAHRGINDLPSQTTDRPTARRRARTKRTALPR